MNAPFLSTALMVLALLACGIADEEKPSEPKIRLQIDLNDTSVIIGTSAP